MGGTGTRSGEDTNNAKYWSEVAQAASALTFDNVPTKGSLNPVRSNGIYEAIGKRITGTISGNKLVMTDSEITNNSVIEGPYVDGMYLAIKSFSQSGTTITFTFYNTSGNGKGAIAWIRN